MRARVDWFRVLADLQRHGFSISAVCLSIEVPKATLLGWRNLDAEPRHADGERLVQLWSRVTERPRDEVPLNVQDLLSAARAKA